MQYEIITSQRDLNQFCRTAAEASAIAFDTEFVSEDRYRPELCLVQVAISERFTVIDPLAVNDMAPFWELLGAEGHETLVHAGRQELCFCLDAIGKRPHRLFDTQIAAGLIGLEYPAAYNTLIQKLLNTSVGKGETRTDWRRRPLSNRQIDYAVRDVMHLEPLRDTLMQRIETLGRTQWLLDEMDQWQSMIEQAEYTERWRRMSGISGLSPKSLAIARELWTWREEEAKRLDRPPRRILRDDLIAELSKRCLSDIAALKAVRGMNHRDKQRYLGDISACIERAIALPDSQWPKPQRRRSSRPKLNLLGQFLATALSSVCHAKHVAPSLVGTVEDVRELIAWHLRLDGSDDGQPPSLAQGWRCEVVGQTIEDVLSGKLAIRVGDALGDHPLNFEPSEHESQ